MLFFGEKNSFSSLPGWDFQIIKCCPGPTPSTQQPSIFIPNLLSSHQDYPLPTIPIPLSPTHNIKTYHEACAANAAGLLTTKITESPLRNILLTYLSLFTAVPLLRPLPPLEYSVHISFTSSRSLIYYIND